MEFLAWPAVGAKLAGVFRIRAEGWGMGGQPQPIVGGAGETETNASFVLETGIKFRVQLGSSPFKFLTVLTDFWGLRFGVLNKGFFDIDELTYVIEIGAGAW